ncbi:hypothetical protein PHYPSEUDO_010281 [Phytophthora pseudosyringae]|uniref:PDEase domain-containing protein n=1 Tax=Phytophthora pseudosyringae TaxID=221518 RepID=A0A8T1VDG9_9STRA|nr:hypothetical protein PHYPSEUDO_010281 [Phytophthora pseudosyringae]
MPERVSSERRNAHCNGNRLPCCSRASELEQKIDARFSSPSACSAVFGSSLINRQAVIRTRRGGGSGDELYLSASRALPPITLHACDWRCSAERLGNRSEGWSQSARSSVEVQDCKTRNEPGATGRDARVSTSSSQEYTRGCPPISHMGVEAKEHKRRMLLHSMAALARRSMNSSGSTALAPTTAPVATSGGDAAVLSASLSTLATRSTQHDESELRKEPPTGPCILPTAHQPRMAALSLVSQLRISQSSPRLVGTSVVERGAAVAVDHDLEIEEVEEVDDDDEDHDESVSKSSSAPSSARPTPPRRATSALETSSDHTSDESVMYAVALLRRLQQHACDSERGEAAVQREELDQILHGFSRALETVTSTWDERSVENTMQTLFDTHSNVFDESMQNFFIQNFLHESESAKTFRTALRRTSMLRRCLLAMYQSDHSAGGKRSKSMSDDKEIPARRWGEAVARIMKQKEEERRRFSIEVCPEITNPSIVLAVQSEIANIDTWNFDVFAITAAVPGQALCIVGNALLEQYEFSCHFRTTKLRIQSLLRQVQRRYHVHPYHNGTVIEVLFSEHAADVTQTLHHFLSVGNLGSLFAERIKCTALLAAIIHDVGHTSYSNNFHITINDDLAVRYVYRSPLEHMHCALAFQLMKDPQCNVLQGLTKIEQHEVRNYITDMVLATDNSVHSAYLGKLENLVRRATEEGWKADPDDDRVVLQMALHAADVSNPTKPLRMYLTWTERIQQEFYQQGDKERELLLPVSIGYDREQPIPLEKMQAGFIIGIVRPLFLSLSLVPSACLGHCMAQLDANLAHWQEEIHRNQPPPRPAACAPDEALAADVAVAVHSA